MQRKESKKMERGGGGFIIIQGAAHPLLFGFFACTWDCAEIKGRGGRGIGGR